MHAQVRALTLVIEVKFDGRALTGVRAAEGCDALRRGA